MMKLNDKRTPTCPNCGMAKLEVGDVIDVWTSVDEGRYTEFCYGFCPNCNAAYEFNQHFTIEPKDYEILEWVNEDEMEEE